MPGPEVTTSEPTMLEEVLGLEKDYYKRPKPAYEFSNGRQFEDGNGPYPAA